MSGGVRRESQAESRHRRNLEKQVVHGRERRANLGQLLGAVIILITIVVGFTAMFLGQVLGGVLLVAVAITSPLVDLVAGKTVGAGAETPSVAVTCLFSTRQGSQDKVRRGSPAEVRLTK